MPDLESGAEAGRRNKLSKCPSEISISRSGYVDDGNRLWRQSSTGGFRRRMGQNAVASCLASPSISPSRLSLAQQQEPLLDLDENELHRERHHGHDQQDELNGCVPLRMSWLSSILSLASAPRRPTSTDSRQHEHQRRLFIWRAIARRVLQRRLRRDVSGSGRKGRSLPPDMAYDESSYAKNFDLGQESWHRVDEGFRRAAVCEAQCRRSRSGSASATAASSLQCGCRLASLDPAILTENL